MKIIKYLLVALLLFIISGNVNAQLKLPTVFSSHMILQREKPVKIWGWANPGMEVKVSLEKAIFKSTATADSIWSITLPVMKAGGPYVVQVKSSTESITIEDVYFGDVWFCGGQSNMNFRMGQIKDHDQELLDAEYPLIRQLDVARVGAELPQNDILKSTWTASSAKTMDRFSAVAYQFAKNLYKKNGVPIGLINGSWGGSPIEAFMSADALKDFPYQTKQIAAITPTFIRDTKAHNLETKAAWERNFYAASVYIDPTLKLNRDASFFDGTGWADIQVPGFVDDQGVEVKKGISWYKKTFSLRKEEWKGTLSLDLGRINFASAVYVNGIYAGTQLNPYYNASFKISADLLKDDKNEILVCGYNENDKTGFRPISKPVLKSGTTSFALDGKWKYRQGRTYDKAGALGNIVSVDFENGYPTLAYNSMIHPFTNYAIKGVIWYQGEANATVSGCWQYERLLTSLIASWRKLWKDDGLPFLLVQIANYGSITKEPVSSAWAVVQEAQTAVSVKVPNCGIVVTNDIGNPIDVHPTNKQEVGRRLALLARAKVYGEKNLVCGGPMYRSMQIKGNEVILSFDQLGSGILSKSDGNKVSSFAVAGADNKFYRAQGKISGNKIILIAEDVAAPVQVRYAFESSPPLIDFYNKEGFPAVPFRTDNLKDVGKKN